MQHARNLLLILLLLAAACDQGPAGEVDEDRAVTVAEASREYRLFIPAGVTEPAALVVVFHGLGGEPAGVRALSDFDDLAREKGFVVAFPAGVGLIPGWRTGAGSGPDVALARAIVEDVADVVQLDRDRIFAAGMSNGGGMAGRLACDASDVFAAVGVVAAAHGFGACGQDRPVAIIGFHGDADRIAPMDGVPFVMQEPHRWIERRSFDNGCGSQPQLSRPAPDVEMAVFSECTADVVFYSIEGGRHGWPGSDRAAATGDSTSGLDATRLMWEFFAARPMA